jgi:DNA modification methylase
MPKNKSSAQQATLFHRDIPKMPDGYYSSGPNPNLHRFVEKHATPYDSAEDDYNVLPFDQPITTTKATAIYYMHTYWSKKPHDAIQQYIRHYTKPGDLVLDPFCGSGGTALAALMEGRAAIAIDLSPAATFITKNYCTPMDVDELQTVFEELKAKVKTEMDWLYETRCDRCDGQATTAYTVYSYVFQCPRCLTKLPLFDCPEVPAHTAAGKEKSIHICPLCLKKGHEEEIKTSSQRFDPIPVLVSYLCDEGCKPQRGERRHNDPDPKKKMYFEKYDLVKIAEINGKNIPHWFPPHRMMNVESETEPWGDKWRAGTSNFRTVAGLFTTRNLWALALMKHKNTESEFKDLFNFTLTGASLHCSKMAAHKEAGGGFMMGTYYIPQIFKERNVMNTFSRKFEENIQGFGISRVQETGILISTQSATKMAQIGNDVVDHIFTDPPYADKIQYGELNFVWEAWLDFDTHWHDQEVIVNNVRNVTESDWASLMQQAMSECFRVLKPGRWISLCYHDTSEGTWQLLQDIMTEVGFIPERSEKSLFIDAGQKSYNQLVAEKVTKRDLVINFRKPREGEIAAKVLLNGEEAPSSFSEKAHLILREALERHPGSPADRLYDELVSRMVRKGQFQRHNFDELLRTVAEETGGRWYLLETADQLDETESKKENAVASRLETLMQKYIKKHPGEIGVHYSNLFEEYLPIKDKPRRLLQDWLPEFFYKTEEGTWRPPFNEEERQTKLSLRLTGELRHIKRFANALSAGIPPAERDRPSNASTLAEWIYQCRRSGLYDLGRILYERGGLRFDSLKEERQLQVEEDYQICVKRGSSTEKKSTRKKKEQPDLF